MYKLTKEGKLYLEKGLPEKQLLKILPASISEVKEKVTNSHLAIANAKKKDWITIQEGTIHITEPGETVLRTKTEEEIILENVSQGMNVHGDTVNELIKRNIIEEIREDVVSEAQKYVGQEITNLTPALIKTGLWKETKIKPYNVSEIGKTFIPGKRHIRSMYVERIRNIFFDMGFTETEGPYVESSFWNFDVLFVPQDHPAREMQDTFFMKKPNELVLPDPKMVAHVKQSHEEGIMGSRGWKYNWSESLAKKTVLRTHTTSVSARKLSEIKPPAKIFCIGKVFRNETIDYKHGAEFTQVEGIVVDENVSFRDLLGYLKEFYHRMGFEKVRFRPAYFPYTEMSVEPEVWLEEKQEWMELGGAGILRPEVTEPLGITTPVLAWGLGLERLIMVSLGWKDIRNFYYKNDLELLRNTTMKELK